MSTTPDPRPLTGEPVALDLLNTRWMHEGAVRDLLTDTEGLAVWLAANGLDFPADDTVLRHVLQARDTLRAAVDGPPEAPEAGEPLADAVAARVDAVLAHGRVRLTLTAHGPGETPSSATPPGDRHGWRPATIWSCWTPPRTASAAAPTTRASCISSTPHGTAPAAGARWRPAVTARRRPATTRARKRVKSTHRVIPIDRHLVP